MRDSELARIFYTIVHDFDSSIVNDAIAEIECFKNTNYLKQIVNIFLWSKKKGYDTICERSFNMLNKIHKKIKGVEIDI